MRLRLSFVSVLILVMLVSACGGNQTTPPSPSSPPSGAEKNEPKGSLTIVQGAEPDLLEPLYSDGSAEYTVVVNIMDGLFTTGKDLRITPVLAESYELIDENTWEFKLRKGVKFQNGEEFNAATVKFSYDMALDPKREVRNEWGNDINLKEVQVVDDFTVRFITTAPTPHLLSRIANDHFIYPPKYYTEVGKDGFTKKPVGTGAYKFKEWNRGDKIVLEANTDYWGGVPAVKNVTFKFVPEEGARVAELETGNADIIINLAPDLVSSVKGKAKTDVIAIDGGRRVYLGMVTQGDSPTANTKVRQAINYGINVEEIAQSLFNGTVNRMVNPVNPPNRNPAVKGYSYNPDLAKKLLAEAGYPNGFSTSIQAYMGVAMKDREFLQAIVADLRKIGVELDLQILERKSFNSLVADRKNADIYLRTTAGGFDMGIDMSLFRPTHGGNGTRWEPQAFVDLYELVNTTVNETKRLEHAYAVQKLIVEEAPWVFLWRQPEIYGVSKRLKGFAPQGDERVRVFQLSLEGV